MLEYAIMVGIVVGSLSVMQTYVRRALAARMHDASLRGLPAGSEAPQYAPYYERSRGGSRSRLGARYTVTPGGVTGKASFIAVTECDDPDTAGVETECRQETTAAP